MIKYIFILLFSQTVLEGESHFYACLESSHSNLDEPLFKMLDLRRE